jgi:LPS sulfotransferase NodH
MKPVQKITEKLKRSAAWVSAHNVHISEPIFIIGCGRSGTTILGKLIEQHPSVVYLNEPRHIWTFEPKTDIWSSRAQLNGGKLCMDEKDFNARVAAKIQRGFSTELRLHGKQKLIEKLPVNSFRIRYIRSLFPTARFIHMVRNGVEVAYSISELFEKTGQWFGQDGYKWQLLVDYALSRGEQDLVNLCSDDAVLKGMLEWHLSVSSAIEELEKLPATSNLEIRYEELVDSPTKICELLQEFIGLNQSNEMHHFASTQISRRSSKIDLQSISPNMKKIGGKMLAKLGFL